MFSETFEQAVVIPAQIYPCSFQLAASIHPQKTRSSCSSTLRKVKKQASVNSLLTDPLSKQQARNRFFCRCAPANKQASKQALTSRAAICWNREPHGHLLEQVVGGQTAPGPIGRPAPASSRSWLGCGFGRPRPGWAGVPSHWLAGA